jgi:phenylpropionate dioxygenase-like ring-hydroxylating dioxygenase large terminal subunit
MYREVTEAQARAFANITTMAAQPDSTPRGISGDIYTSEPLLQLELERLFKHEWCCVGRVDELPQPGDYLTTEIGIVPIIVIRRDSGEIGAMVNVCSHRLSQVAKGSGNAKRFACPYHGWVYGREGELIQATHMPATFDKSSCALKSAQVECWNGFIYVNVDPHAPPLAPRLEPLGSLIAPYHLERMQTLHKGYDVWDANWKVPTENFLESYHIDMVHSQTLAPLVPHDTLKMIADGPGFAFHTFRWADIYMGPQDPAIAVENLDLDEEARRTVYVGGVFPNHLFTVAYDQITWMRCQPIAVDKTLIEWGVAGAFNIPRGTKPNPDHPNLNYLRAIPAVNAEDKPIVEGVQRGARAGMVKPAQLHPYERPLLMFARYLADRLGAAKT